MNSEDIEIFDNLVVRLTQSLSKHWIHKFERNCGNFIV